MIKRMALAATALVLVASAATALDFDQKHWYSQGILSLPMGNFGDFANLGIGAGVGLSAPSSADLNFRGEISYIYFLTDDFGGAETSASMIPILVLAHYGLKDSQAYLLGGLGIVIVKTKFDYSGPFASGSFSHTDSELGLVLGGGYALSPTMNLEGRLNVISDANSISAHLSFRF